MPEPHAAPHRKRLHRQVCEYTVTRPFSVHSMVVEGTNHCGIPQLEVSYERPNHFTGEARVTSVALDSDGFTVEKTLLEQFAKKVCEPAISMSCEATACAIVNEIRRYFAQEGRYGVLKQIDLRFGAVNVCWKNPDLQPLMATDRHGMMRLMDPWRVPAWRPRHKTPEQVEADIAAETFEE